MKEIFNITRLTIKLLLIILDPIVTCIVHMEGRLGIILRRIYYRTRLGTMGRSVRIDPGVHIDNPKYIHIGDHVWIDRNVKLIAGLPGGSRRMKIIQRKPDISPGVLRIGRNCHIAPDVIIQAHGGVEIGSELTIAAGAKIYSLSHHYRNPDEHDDTTPYRFVGIVDERLQFLLAGSIIIGDGAGVALNTVLLPGSRLGNYAWLTTGSVLKGEIPPGGIASGNPAKIIKFRPGFTESDS